jgi:hypothetical protein
MISLALLPRDRGRLPARWSRAPTLWRRQAGGRSLANHPWEATALAGDGTGGLKHFFAEADAGSA